MTFLGFDPGAIVGTGTETDALAEITMYREEGGALVLMGATDEGREISIRLRPDFLDEFLAQARAREQDAAA